MRILVVALLMALAAMRPAWAQPGNVPAWLNVPLPPGWQRIDEFTFRRVDIANAATQWVRVDANRWHLLAPGETAHGFASR